MASKRRRIARGYFRGSITVGALAAAIALPSAFPSAAFRAQAQEPAAAPAPQIPEIRPGATVRSSLARDTDGTHEDYRLHLEANEAVRIDMDSPGGPAAETPASTAQTPASQGFDTYLELRRPGVDEPLMGNDDRGDGTLNSRLFVTAPSVGDYIVRARPLSQIRAGDVATYSLTVVALPPAPPPIEFSGSRVEGELGAASPVGESFGTASRYAAYWVNGTAGERIQLDMASSGSGPSLQLIDSNSRILATETGYDQNAARLIAVLPETGRYLVRAQIPPDQSARYTLELSRATIPPAAEEPDRVNIGETVNGALTLRSNANSRSDGSGQIEFFYAIYALRVRAGETLTVTLEATGFQPVIEAGTLSVLGFVSAVVGSSGAASGRLVLQPFQSGTAYLRARATGLGFGTFRLRVVPGMAPPGQ